MNENSIEANKINTLQAPSIPSTIYYLGVLFTAGAIVGSLIGIMMTKEK